MFSRMRKLSSLGSAAGVCGGLVVGWWLVANNTTTAKASWTTDFTPSVQWDWNWDRREPSSLLKPSKNNKRKNGLASDELKQCSLPDSNLTDSEKLEARLDAKKSTASRYIILIRHGQYNLDGETDKDRKLTELGREQSKLTGERLKALNLPITRLIHSTMTRATETANIMMQHMDKIEKVESSDLIREGAPIPPEPPIGHWQPENYQFFTDGPRIEAGFRHYFHRASQSQTQDSYEVVVCHANVIRYVVCRALQFPPEAWLRMNLHNGSLTILTIRPDGRVSMRQLGECGHMPPSKLSFT